VWRSGKAKFALPSVAWFGDSELYGELNGGRSTSDAYERAAVCRGKATCVNNDNNVFACNSAIGAFMPTVAPVKASVLAVMKHRTFDDALHLVTWRGICRVVMFAQTARPALT